VLCEFDHWYEKGPVPFVAVAVNVSRQLPLQGSFHPLKLLEVMTILITTAEPAGATEAVAVQPFTSVTVTVYVPMQALNNESDPLGQGGPGGVQQYVYGPIPPAGNATSVSVQPALQLAIVEVRLTESAGGSIKVTVSLVEQPLVSVIWTT